MDGIAHAKSSDWTGAYSDEDNHEAIKEDNYNTYYKND